MVPASSVQVGDRISSITGESATSSFVTKIVNIQRQGVFASFTETGKFVVNGILSSNYITLQADSAFLVVAGIDTPLSMYWLAHSFQVVHRSACQINWSWCKEETYTADGLSSWVSRLHELFCFIPPYSPVDPSLCCGSLIAAYHLALF